MSELEQFDLIYILNESNLFQWYLLNSINVGTEFFAYIDKLILIVNLRNAFTGKRHNTNLGLLIYFFRWVLVGRF